MTATNRTITVDLYSDFSCPWCFVGKTRLDRAIAALEKETGGSVTVERQVHPFILMPTMTKTEEWVTFYEPYAGFVRHEDHPAFVQGRADGLAFSGWKFVPTTIDANRLVFCRCPPGPQRALVSSKLFSLNYDEGADIGDRAVLAKEFAALTGEKVEQVREYLESGKDVDKVLAMSAESHKVARRGVPHFVFSGGSVKSSTSLIGAYPVDEILAALRKHAN